MKIWTVVTLLLGTALYNADTCEPKRSKLSSEFGLTPFLRSGRTSFDSNTDVKRRIGKMVPFPRIGRADSWGPDDNNYGAKRPGGGSGMWFGPRLGRFQKRNEAGDLPPYGYFLVMNNGESPVTKPVHYIPRLGRESEEVEEERKG